MNTRAVAQTGVLLAVALAVQTFHLPPLITGPAINAVLIVSAAVSGMLSGILIGCITPIMALALGVVHPISAPLVPVIIAANATLVAVFSVLSKKNQYVAFIVAAGAKFSVFYVAINFLLKLLQIKLPVAMLAGFQLPQLITALVGGMIGVAVIKYLETYQKHKEDIPEDTKC